MFDINSLVNSKDKNKNHSNNEIQYIVNSFVNGIISDDEMTSWLKAVFNNGMSLYETVYYTKSIIDSGSKIKFDNLNGYIVDKHSTGGVGDKVSLILGPILAACNCYVPMIVGRFLEHTGGTLDKLESIDGYNGLLSSDKFIDIVNKVGISIIGQTDEICPADRKIYSLRGRTNTVASFPLICGSIMSKKIAEGIQGLVLDIKIGSGAFIKNVNDANKLGELLTLIGSKFGVKVKYIHSDMSQPLGSSAGLLCEIEESIKALSGKGANDLMDVVFELGDIALNMAGEDKPKDRMLNVISDGSAKDVFFKMIYAHGGDLSKIVHKPKNNFDIISEKVGYLKYIDTKKIGNVVNYLTILNGNIDKNAGINFLKKNGDFINRGDVILQIFSDSSKNIEISKEMIKGSYVIIENY
tara:strand:+ start:543 stop:1775 length:1233 start_codon:yes stop_codon:yes gene_type:complete